MDQSTGFNFEVDVVGYSGSLDEKVSDYGNYPYYESKELPNTNVSEVVVLLFYCFSF